MNTWKKISAFDTLLVFFLLLSTSLPIFAETFVLKDGRILKGKLIQYHTESIDIQTEDGQFQTIDRKAIQKVQYGEDHEAERQKKLLEKEAQEKDSRQKESEQNHLKPPAGRKVNKPEEPPNYILQSAIFPGLGLLSQNRKKEGYTFSGLFFLTALFALYQRNEYINAKQNYEFSVRESLILSYTTQNLIPGIVIGKDKYSEFQYEESEYNKAVLLCGMVYLGQLAWTYYLGKKTTFGKNAFEFNILPNSTEAYGQTVRDSSLPVQAHFQYHFYF